MTFGVNYAIFLFKLQLYSSMTVSINVRFFIQPNNSDCTLSDYASRILYQIYSTEQPQSILIQCDNQPSAEELDHAMWHFHPYHFLPHSVSDSTDPLTKPIHITYQHNPNTDTDICVNYNRPEFQSQARQIIEIIACDEHSKKLARQRYRCYQQQHATIETHTDVR